MLDAIAQWWDGVELWMAQLPFPFQFALLMAILLPLSLGAARLIDRVVDNASSRFNPPAPGGAPVEPDRVDPGPSS
ncbi:hypothetical protein [Actinosynnema sp. NPDC023587]|uniref:hypothetical protein n=1 Tax=Actinosynnema sp. NPDC023587 TaxID=3154695 RepID=UPI0033E80243